MGRSSMQRSLALVAAIAAAPHASGDASTFQLPWTTDFLSSSDTINATYGPDGPWQALLLYAGNGTRRTFTGAMSGVEVALWPSGTDVTELLSRAGGGFYQPKNSTAAVSTGVSAGNSDLWLSTVFRNESTSGFDYYDLLGFTEKLDSGSVQVNATVMAGDERVVNIPGRPGNYTDPVGLLGLGPPQDGPGPPSLAGRLGLLSQLKKTGKTTSASCGLHMGSVALGQPGSMVLGGYEQNRALGDVGIFTIKAGLPALFLVDVVLGTQVGGSPFKDIQGTESVYQGLGGNSQGETITKSLGGKAGSAVVIPNPASPYIYLPLGTCEEAAKHLPVTLSKDLGLYLWNTDDPQYSRIVTSPAYLGFVLSDRTATNVTIKVPFKLLNLTLSAPLVDTPTQYFPCQSLNSSYGMWQLGRAFLQAAFLGLNYERNLTYIAQAPGPNMDQSVIQVLAPTAETLKTNSIDTIENTRQGYWKQLPGNSQPVDQGPGAQQSGLSTGAVVGIVVGMLAVGIAAVVTAVFFWRKRKRQQSSQPDAIGSSASALSMWKTQPAHSPH